MGFLAKIFSCLSGNTDLMTEASEAAHMQDMNNNLVSKPDPSNCISEAAEEDDMPQLLQKSSILENKHVRALDKELLPSTVGCPWSLVYGTDQHGFSLTTMYRLLNNVDAPVLLAIKDTNGQVFGAMLATPPRQSKTFNGSGQSFLWTFFPNFKKFSWSGENEFFANANPECLCIEAGKGSFGIWLDGGLDRGRTQSCPTYENDVLTETEDFMIQNVEVLGFL